MSDEKTIGIIWAERILGILFLIALIVYFFVLYAHKKKPEGVVGKEAIAMNREMPMSMPDNTEPKQVEREDVKEVISALSVLPLTENERVEKAKEIKAAEAPLVPIGTKYPYIETVSWNDPERSGRYDRSFSVEITWLSSRVFKFGGEVRAYKPAAKRYANFKRVKYKHYTMAVDYAFIPLGSIMAVPNYGWEYQAEARDTGPNCIGNKCEVMYSVWKNGRSPHRRAKKWGVKYKSVKVKLPSEGVLLKWANDERLRVRVGAEWALRKLREHGVIK